MQRSRKTDRQIGKLNKIICAVEFQFPFDDASKFLSTTIFNISIATTQFFSCLAQNNILNHYHPIFTAFMYDPNKYLVKVIIPLNETILFP